MILGDVHYLSLLLYPQQIILIFYRPSELLLKINIVFFSKYILSCASLLQHKPLSSQEAPSKKSESIALFETVIFERNESLGGTANGKYICIYS